jgi:hypothetical protein
MKSLNLFSILWLLLTGVTGFAYTPVGDSRVVFWLDAGDPGTLREDSAETIPVSADGQLVGKWADKSGSGWDVIANGGPAGKPTFKVNQQNSRPSIRFDGTSDSMSTLVASLQGSAYTIFVVSRQISHKDLAALLSIHDGSSLDWNNASSVCLGLGYGNVLTDVRSQGLLSQLSHPGSGVSFMFTTKYDGTNNTAYVNGVGAAPVASGGNFGAETITLGARGSNLGDLNHYEYFEVLIYSGALSDEDREAVEDYLGSKYAFANTQWAPPPPPPPQTPVGPYTPELDPHVVFWLDSSDANSLYADVDGTTAVSSDGQFVGKWTDKSGSNWHVVANGGDTGKPIYKANQQNGRPSVRFDGTSDSMSALAASLQGSAYTIFVVSRRTSQRNQEALLSIHEGESPDWDNPSSVCLGFGYGEILADARNFQLQSQLSHPGSGVSFMFATKYDGVNNTAYVNGVGAAPVSSTGSFNAQTITLGARGPNLADLNKYEYFEVLIYDFAMSDEYRQVVESYLGSKYALPNTQWAPPPPPPPQPPVGPYVPEEDSRLVFWLNAADSSTLFQDLDGVIPVTGDGQAVGLWADKSGNDWHVTANGGATGKPTYKVNRLNGLPAIRFDGNSDSMSTMLASLRDSNYTIVIVGRRLSHKPFEAMLSIHDEGALDWNNSESVCVGYSDGSLLADARDSVLKGQTGHPGSGIPFLYMTTYDGTTNRVFVNGVAGTPALSTKRLGAETITLGARSANVIDYNNYEYFEVLVYDFAFSDAYRQAVETHLGSKYAIPNSPWAPPPPPPPQPPVGPYNPAVDTRVVFWLDAADSGTLFQDVGGTIPVANDGDLIGTWTDKSANGWHVHATGGNPGKPTFKQNQQNGRPSVRFDGNSDSLSTQLAALQGTEYTAFIVGRRISYRPGEALLSIHDAGSVDWNSSLSMCVGYSDGKTLADARKNALLGKADHPSAGVVFLYATKYNGSANTPYVNGYAGQTAASNGNLDAEVITLGARGAVLAEFNNYEYFEVLILDFAVSDAYRQAVEAYLKTKYAIDNMAGSEPPAPPAEPPLPGGVYSPVGDSRVTFWLDSADSSTLFQDVAATIPAATDGVPVAIWKDKSPKGWHVSVAGGDADSRPAYKANQQNGIPSVRFDGVADFLRTNAASLQGTDYTVFVVSRRSGFVDLEAMLSIHDAGSPDWENNFSVCLGHNVFFGEHQNFMGDCRTDILLSETAHPGDDIAFIYASKYDGSNNTAYINGIGGAPAPSVGRFSAETITLGARNTVLNHFNKYEYFEVLIFDFALSDTYRQAVESYLRNKYGLAGPQ